MSVFIGSKPTLATGWYTLPLGAGGYVPQIQIAADGTRVVTTDVGNAYLWNSSSSSWLPLITTTSLPSGTVSNNGGVFSFAIAPSNTQHFYMCWASNGVVYSSTNQGITWTATALTDGNTSSNDSYHGYAKGMAVDPANENVIWFGSKTALYTSTNSGGSWTTKTSLIASPIGPGYQIGFDPTSSVIGGKTQGIFVFVYGTGLYYSSNAGTSFSSVSTTGSPAGFAGAMVVGQDGVVFIVDGTNSQKLYTYSGGSGGSWASTVAGSAGVGSNAWSVAIDPANPVGSTRRLVVTTPGGPYSVSTNNAGSFSGFTSPAGTTLSATDIPWLANSGSGYISAAGIAFDPLQSNVLIVGAGVGVFTTSPLNSSLNANITYTSQSKGIEELVVDDIIAPNGVPIVAVQDRGSFYANSTTVFPTSYNNLAFSNSSLLSEGWHIDYSGSSSTTLGISQESITGSPSEQSGTSTDGGQTWTAFSTTPVSGYQGCIAMGYTSGDILWAATLGAAPYYTTNGSSSWTQISISTITWSSWLGVLADTLIASDKSSQKYYLWDPSSGFYSSTTGASWTRVNNTTSVMSTGSWSLVKTAPPGYGGYLGISAGYIGDGHAGIKLSVDGGTTFTSVTSLADVNAWGFGAAKSGSSYPTIFANGSISGVFSNYRSTDWGATWTNLGQANNVQFYVSAMSGDNTTYTKVYAGFNQQGAVYGVFT
jgi:hypothetical protein